ncbi:DUF2177 family protein [archaeon]|nr:DUF2177 family protein [archaeon]
MLVLDYLITLGVFFGIDLLWLRYIAKKLYQEQIGYLLTDKPKRLAAFIFYLLFVVGLLVFVINPSTTWAQASMLGALFGLITYATYDLTNLATIKKWPLKITIIDLVWGSFLASIVSTISYLVINL